MKIAYLLSTDKEESEQIYQLVQSKRQYMIATLPVSGIDKPELRIGQSTYRGFEEVKKYFTNKHTK